MFRGKWIVSWVRQSIIGPEFLSQTKPRLAMQHLDYQVVQFALARLARNEPVWFCTVLSTFGSSPREPGSNMAIASNGEYAGSLSGGCVEEDFLARLNDGRLPTSNFILRYGVVNVTPEANNTNETSKTNDANVTELTNSDISIAPTITAKNNVFELSDASVSLPCGGVLDVLVQYFTPSVAITQRLEKLLVALEGTGSFVRKIDLQTGEEVLTEDSEHGSAVEVCDEYHWVRIKVGPVARLIIAGISPVTEFCAEFAKMLGFEVLICDAREDEFQQLLTKSLPSSTPTAQTENIVTRNLPELTCLSNNRVAHVHLNSSLWAVNKFPADVIMLPNTVHNRTAIVALTHDPRIDDLALMEAVETDAFYIGVMGSFKTSNKRAERLQRSGELTDEQIARIKMPIGLNLGSKTPAEIALAVMADILRVYRGIADSELR